MRVVCGSLFEFIAIILYVRQNVHSDIIVGSLFYQFIRLVIPNVIPDRLRGVLLRSNPFAHSQLGSPVATGLAIERVMYHLVGHLGRLIIYEYVVLASRFGPSMTEFNPLICDMLSHSRMGYE